MEIIDIALIGAAGLFALIGLIKGGAKIFFGIFMLLVIMVGASFISAAVCPLFLQTKSDGELKPTAAATLIMKPIDNALPKDGTFGELLNTVITKGEDGTLFAGEKTLKSAVEANVPYVGAYIAPVIEKLTIPGVTFRESFTFTLAKFAYETVVWLAFVILLVIIRNVIRKSVYRFLDNNSLLSKLDRVIGLVISVAVVLALFWGAGAVLAYFDDGANWAHSANDFILKGSIAKPLYTANPLLKLIHVTLPVTPSAE